jgi:hypothetical protein
MKTTKEEREIWRLYRRVEVEELLDLLDDADRCEELERDGEMKVEIASITLVVGTHGDTAYLETDLPPSLYPPSPVCLKLEIARGRGVKYIRDNFPGVSLEVIDVAKGKIE